MSAGGVTTTVDLLRHGEVLGGQYYRGITDDPLTAAGWQQMMAQCRQGQWDWVISSPLQRCRAFADDLMKQAAIPLQIEPAWMEIDFGDWEGLSADEIQQRDPDGLQAFYQDPLNHSPPNGEDYADFSDRVYRAWQNLLLEHRGKRLLIITHAGVIRALFVRVLDIPVTRSLQIAVPHACLTRFTCYHDGGDQFIQFNSHQSA